MSLYSNREDKVALLSGQVQEVQVNQASGHPTACFHIQTQVSLFLKAVDQMLELYKGKIQKGANCNLLILTAAFCQTSIEQNARLE